MKLATVMLAPVVVVMATQTFAADKHLKNDKSKMSYAIGLNIGENLKRGDIDLDIKSFTLAIEDIMSGKKPRLNEKEMQQAFTMLRDEQMKKQARIAKEDKLKSEKFLAENKKKPGIKVLPSGVQYRVIKSGTGKHPKGTDTIVAHYRGSLIDGTVFDSSYKRGQPLTIPVNQVVKGWQDALKAMKVGGKWQVYIPPELGYGERATGSIPPNSALIFDIELLKIK